MARQPGKVDSGTVLEPKTSYIDDITVSYEETKGGWKWM